MAERERFELSVLAYTRVPGVHLKPLGHLSVRDIIKNVGYYVNFTITFGNEKNALISKNYIICPVFKRLCLKKSLSSLADSSARSPPLISSV